MSEHYDGIISEDDAGERVDKFLSDRLPHLSRSFLKQSFLQQQVYCNQSVAAPKYRLRQGDHLSANIILPTPTQLKPCATHLDILYEDEDIIVINKPSACVVHIGNGTHEPTLVEQVLAYCPLSSLAGPLRPGVVHRLDKDTSGAIILAKTDQAYLQLIKMFAEHAIQKTYYAIVCGHFDVGYGEIRLPIKRDRWSRTKMTTGHEGKEAITQWQVVTSFGDRFSLLKIHILTGRTHQIRVHLSTIGHVLWGDIKYGYQPSFFPEKMPQRMLLHAQALSFAHPITHVPLQITAPFPEDFSEALHFLKKRFQEVAI